MSHLTSEDFSEITPEDQYPEKYSLCSTTQWKQNWKCVLLTFLIFSCLLSVLFCHRQLSNQVALNQEHSSSRNIRWMLLCCSVILYSLYLMECSYATDKIQLCNQSTANLDQVKEKIERMKNSDPIIWWKATCYHYARKKRRTTQYRRGTYFVSTKVYQERINSFTSSSSFNFSCCGVKDISNNLIIDESCGPIVKFRFSKGFAFANMASAVEFEEQHSMFFRELSRYDEYMEIHEGLDMSDCITFEEEVIALNTSKRPWFANPFYYWLYSCCLLSWPFRLILLYNTAHVHYKITKLFGANYSNMSDSAQQLALLQLYGSYSVDENDETPAWSDIATLNESANDIHITSILVPSYSEALLLDDHQALIPETQSARNVPIEVLNKDTRRTNRVQHYASTGRLHSFDDSTDSNLAQSFPPQTSVDNPPTYEEALMFPVVEHPTVGHSRQPESDKNNSNQNQSPSHAQNETRLPNSRTFLSIETSL